MPSTVSEYRTNRTPTSHGCPSFPSNFNLTNSHARSQQWVIRTTGRPARLRRIRGRPSTEQSPINQIARCNTYGCRSGSPPPRRKSRKYRFRRSAAISAAKVLVRMLNVAAVALERCWTSSAGMPVGWLYDAVHTTLSWPTVLFIIVHPFSSYRVLVSLANVRTAFLSAHSLTVHVRWTCHGIIFG